jgi:hypothetical protein
VYEGIGYDAGKRVRGRKRHLLVDAGGLIMRAVVHPASVQDRAAAELVLDQHREFAPVGLVWVDDALVTRLTQNMPLSLAEFTGMTCRTSQCSTTLPLSSRRKM